MTNVKRFGFCVGTVAAFHLIMLGYQTRAWWPCVLGSAFAVGMLYAAIVPEAEQ